MGSTNTIYHKRQYNIYAIGNNEFIIHNSALPFEQHHTHIAKFSTAKYLINIVIHKSIPKHLSSYLIVSLIRLSDDKAYNDKLYQKLDENKKKKESNKDNKTKYMNGKIGRCKYSVENSNYSFRARTYKKSKTNYGNK